MIDLDLKFVIKLTDPGLRLRYRDDEIKAAHLIIKDHQSAKGANSVLNR